MCVDTLVQDTLIQFFSFNNLLLLLPGVSPEDRDVIHQNLLRNTDFVEADIFNDAKNHAVKKLEPAWIRFLKEDMKSFYE